MRKTTKALYDRPEVASTGGRFEEKCTAVPRGTDTAVAPRRSGGILITWDA